MIMIVLLNHADDSGKAWPSQSRIASQTGLSDRCVRNNLRELCDSGWLKASEKFGQTTIYDIATPEPRSETPERDSCAPRNDVPHSPSEPRNDVPTTPERRSAQPERRSGNPGTTFLLSTQEPTKNQPLNQTSAEPPEKNGQEQKLVEPKRKPNSWRDDAKLKAQEASLTPLPLDLASDAEVAALWRAWCEHRTHIAEREKTKPWTPRAAEMEIANIAKAIDQHGHEVVCTQIRTAISSSWQGLNLQNIRPQFGRKRYGDDHDDRPTGL